MMQNHRHPGRHAGTRRGFTLLETILAISITAMVGAGIATMMAVLGSDASMQYDLRSVLVRSSAAQSRLSAYIAPARCLLEADAGALVLWFDDSRRATRSTPRNFDGSPMIRSPAVSTSSSSPSRPHGRSPPAP